MQPDRPCQDPNEQHAWAATASEALRVLEGKWKIVIIVQLFAADGPLRFSELERRIPGVTQKMLIQQLKGLEDDGIITRTLYPQVPPKVEYALSEIGRALGPAFDALVKWAEFKEEARLPAKTRAANA
jgi:DNA-binding HxlR family transcriptional regulator